MKALFLLALAFVSLQAFGQRIETGRDSKTFVVTSDTNVLNLDFSLPVYRYDYVRRTVLSTCYRTECSTQSGNGSQGDWKGFYNVPREQKASALAAAVKGIGRSTAEKIVDNNLLTHKPDSWNLFVAEIRKIERQLQRLGYQATFANEVIEVYGYENRINLGYASAESCSKVPYSCYIEQVVEVKTRLSDVYRSLQVVVKDQTLQSFERDTVTVTVGEANNDVYVSANGYNNYSSVLLNRGGTVDLTGSRIKRAFPVDEVRAYSAKVNASQLEVNVTVPQKYFSEDTSKLSMTVEICKTGFLGLGCKTQGVYQVSDVSTSFTQSYNITGKGTFFAQVRFSRLGSEYYSSASSAEITTNKIKY